MMGKIYEVAFRHPQDDKQRAGVTLLVARRMGTDAYLIEVLLNIVG